MTALKLGIEGLESSDASRVRILLRLLKGNSQFAWEYSADGPFDALLCANAVAQARCAVVIDVLPEGSAAAGALSLPIEAEQLETLLLSLQNQLQPTVFGELLTEPDELLPSFAQTHAVPLAPVAEQASAQSQALLPPLTALPHFISAAQTPLTGAEEYKLKRWPPQAVLRDSKDRIRLANLISRKHFSVDQLAQSSGIAVAEVQAFITVLQSFGIVNVALATPIASVQRLSTATCAAPRQKQKRSFLSALRRKLGI